MGQWTVDRVTEGSRCRLPGVNVTQGWHTMATATHRCCCRGIANEHFLCRCISAALVTSAAAADEGWAPLHSPLPSLHTPTAPTHPG